MELASKRVPAALDHHAPDGCEVRELYRGRAASVAHFVLPPRTTSRAVTHKTIEEVWYFVSGHGRMWRRLGGREDTVDVAAEVALTLPVGTHCQVRNTGYEPLVFVIATMPPWPGPDEAVFVDGPWPPGPLGGARQP